MSEEHFSLSGQVFGRIREGILSGKYAANEELKEKTLGEEFGVSRTPVREALRQLELEGLVSIIPNKGAYVIGVSLQDIKDIYEMRCLLEGLCASWAAEKITQEQLAELDENIFLTEFHAEKENWCQMVELDNRFHELLYQASGSRELSHVLRDYHQYVQRVRKVSLGYPKRVQESKEEHKAIVEALRSKDPKKAQELATKHIRNTISNMDRLGWENMMK
ncbi:MAG: GntR family transcriptional regulator [Agathobacter sp.]|nr:GntR family transcriptional regulator [Agathobacter sp.]MBQ2283918.1 GntR family transcriptional regulator [Agathobacter sp.]